MKINENFKLTSVSQTLVHAVSANPYAPIDILIGKWKGTGFNQIWRPFFGGPPNQDRFLELNETIEELEFTQIPGDIPNRGLLQADINLHGLTYLQQIQDAHAHGPDGSKFPGIHIEPGIWVTVPNTTNPSEPATVARLANIPHGTSIVAQGTALPTINAAPPFAHADITPFLITDPSHHIPFPEQNLGTPSAFRTKPADIPNVTQAWVDNPNIVLSDALKGVHVNSTSTLAISTSIPPVPPTKIPTSPNAGGGTSNIAFLQGIAGNPNANAAEVDAIFWIEQVTTKEGYKQTWLQYSQRVLLNFKGLSWPHISVATLVKQENHK